MRVQLLSLLMLPAAVGCGQGDKESPRTDDDCEGNIVERHRLWVYQP